jgi:hypothetical protein
MRKDGTKMPRTRRLIINDEIPDKSATFVFCEEFNWAGKAKARDG